MKYIETQFWKFVKYKIRKDYGYCEERDGGLFMSLGRCACCDASDVCDFIDSHIRLLNEEL